MAEEPAHEASQAAQIRALQDILPYLLNKIEATEAQVRDVARLVEIVSEPGEEEPPPQDSARRKRDRHGMYGIRGGLAAFAPVAMFAHGGVGAVLLPGVARLLRHRAGRAAAGVTALAAGAALAIPTVGAFQVPVPAATQPLPVAAHSHHQHPALRPRTRPAAAPRHPQRRHFHGDGDEDADDAFVRYSPPSRVRHSAPRDSDRRPPRHGPGRHGRGHAYGHRRHDHRRRHGHCDASGPPVVHATMTL